MLDFAAGFTMRIALAFGLLMVTCRGVQAAAPFYVGADISMLPEIERAGGVYKDQGKPGDCLRILADRGFNLFRIRLFVNPTTDFAKSYGATQDLTYVRALAKRVKETGGTFLLDLHYSDTWADPGKQHKPAAWKDLEFDALEQRVHDYTRDVLTDLAKHDASPDLVQIGNEIAGGMLWPDGKVLNARAMTSSGSGLVSLGCSIRARKRCERRARRRIRSGSCSTSTAEGREGMTKWFFAQQLSRFVVDFDIVGVSFYPFLGRLDRCAQAEPRGCGAHHRQGRDRRRDELSWRQFEDIKSKRQMRWPLTPAGQKQFLQELASVIRDAPDGHGRGFIYWYPEAIQAGQAAHLPWRGRRAFRRGGEWIAGTERVRCGRHDSLAPAGGYGR
jgi:arabinogalactan endo-1,4-beta-galactosidase